VGSEVQLIQGRKRKTISQKKKGEEERWRNLLRDSEEKKEGQEKKKGTNKYKKERGHLLSRTTLGEGSLGLGRHNGIGGKTVLRNCK